MTERERIHTIMRDLQLPADRYLIGGSGAMVLAGIERTKTMGDLDLFVPTRDWFDLYSHVTDQRAVSPRESDAARAWEVWTTEPTDPSTRCDPPYLRRGMYGLEVNVFFNWRKRGVGDFDVNFWITNAELREGLRCVPLQFLLDWKLQMGRDKDLDDIRLIREYLGNTVQPTGAE